MSALIQVRGRACTAKTADTNVPRQPTLGEKLLDIEVAELVFDLDDGSFGGERARCFRRLRIKSVNR